MTNGTQRQKPIEIINVALKIPAAFVKIAPAKYLNMGLVQQIYPASDGRGYALLVVEFACGAVQKFASGSEQQAILEGVEALAIAPAPAPAPGVGDVEIVEAHPGDLTDTQGFPYIH